MVAKGSNEFNVNELADADIPETPATEIVPEGLEESMSLATVMSEYQGTLQLRREDVDMPRLRLMQAMSESVQNNEAKIGQYMVTGFEKPFNEITVVPMLWTHRQELRDGDFNVLCSSPNGEFGVGNPGGQCQGCPMNVWGGNKQPPACTFFYSYVFYVKETDSLALFDFKKGSVAAGRKMNTSTATNGGLGRVAFKLSSQKVNGKKGTFYIPSMKLLEPDASLFALAQKKMNG